MQLKKIAAVLALAAAGSAHADISLLDSSLYPALVGTNGSVIGGVSFASASGKFVQKTRAGISGLGVTGGITSDEIDVGEKVTLSWTQGLTISSFAVGLLYNGPEFGDWAETAQVKAWNGKSLVGVGALQVDKKSDTVAHFTGTGFGTVINLSPASENKGGGWQVDNPFGNALVTKLEFTALTSKVCGTKSCNNQSDYVLSSVSAVPEPEAYGLALAGMGVLAFMARRSKPKA